MPELINHVETYLGPITSGVSAPNVDTHTPIQLVEFQHVPDLDVTAYMTLGLSRHHTSVNPDDDCRIELLVLLNSSHHSQLAFSLLDTVATETVLANKPLLQGQYMGPREPFLPGSAMNCLYFTFPVYLPPDFYMFQHDDKPTVIVWLVPISQQETHFIHQNGWPAFEELLETADPDLTDLVRPSLV